MHSHNKHPLQLQLGRMASERRYQTRRHDCVILLRRVDTVMPGLITDDGGHQKAKRGRIRLLMRPTPITETFLSRWLIYVIAFPVIFLLSVALADAIRVGIAAITLPDYYAEFIFRPIFIDNEKHAFSTRPTALPHHIRRILHIHLLLHPVAVCARKHDMDPELVSKNIYCIRGADSHIYDMRHDDRRISHVRKNMARTIYGSRIISKRSCSRWRQQLSCSTGRWDASDFMNLT